MAAHEWTRARQRSVRGGGVPIQDEPTPPPASPEDPVLETPPPEEAPVAAEVVQEPAPAEPPAVSEPVVADPLTVEPEPTAPEDDAAEPDAEEPGAADVAAVPEPSLPADPQAPSTAADEGQATLPLGLDPLPEGPPKRTATETREDLIQRLLDPHLTLQETAKLLDVCPTTVRRYTNRGLLAHYRTPGNQRRFRLSDVLGFMERQGIPALGLERKRPDSVEDIEAGVENAT